MGRPDILWTVNTFARAVTKWNITYNQRLARLICYIHFMKHYRQLCQIGDHVDTGKLGLFQVACFAGDWQNSKSTSGGGLQMEGLAASNVISLGDKAGRDSTRNHSQLKLFCRILEASSFDDIQFFSSIHLWYENRELQSHGSHARDLDSAVAQWLTHSFTSGTSESKTSNTCEST